MDPQWQVGGKMSHLIIEQGKEIGREVTIPAGGMKFGRSPANELVLDDDDLMLFHGRFFFKSDGMLWVTDFGAGQKTTVGGVPIDEHQLKIGDLVQAGGTAFRIINATQGEEDAPAPLQRDTDQGKAIDLGFKKAGKTGEAAKKTKQPARSNLMQRLMQVGLSLVVLLVLVVIGSEISKLSSRTTPQVQYAEPLTLSYERVKADSSNIFRYYLNLDDKGMLSIQLDELRSDLHFEKKKRLSDTKLAQLSQSIEEAGFFEVNSDYAGTSQGQIDLFDLAVSRNRRYHRIRVKNNRLPSPIERTETVLEDFAASELDIPFTMTMPSHERIQYGLQALELAGTRYAERDVRHANLAEAIKHYGEAMLFLQNIDEQREQYGKALTGLETATNERDGRYDEFMFRADRSIALAEWQAAYKSLQILQELIPDRDDPRRDKINDKLMSVERNLR
jgi:hypothetical protein